MANTNDITDPKYVLKRLRDSSYKADLLIGRNSMAEKNDIIENFILDCFPAQKKYDRGEVFKRIKQHRQKIARALRIDPYYSMGDSREWTILIDPGGASVFLTLYRNSKENHGESECLGTDYFELFDGGQFVNSPPRYKLSTKSLETVFEYLNDKGIVNKV